MMATLFAVNTQIGINCNHPLTAMNISTSAPEKKNEIQQNGHDVTRISIIMGT